MSCCSIPRYKLSQTDVSSTLPAAIKPAVCYSLGPQVLRPEHLLKRNTVGRIATAKAEPESGCEIQTTASAAVSNPIDHPSKLFPIQRKAPWLNQER